MSIRAIMEGGRDMPEERVIELARGERDEHGKPFTIISLMASAIDHRGSGARFHTCGYQDTFIHVLDSGIEINYGQPGKGDIFFEKNDLGKLIGVVARTPWNMQTLASEYGDKKWRIMDPEVEKEVKAMADKIRVSEDTLQSRKAAKVSNRVRPHVEKEIQRDIEMSKKNDELKKKEEAPPVEDEAGSFPGKARLLEVLAELSYTKLRDRAKATGKMDDKTTKREDFVKVILNYEAAKAEPKGEMEVQ
jgi:hypothetical protein